MRTVTITREYEVYDYNELSKEAKEKAINDKISEWIEYIPFDKLPHNSNLYKAYKESNIMQTPWFLPSYIYDYCKKELEQELKECSFLSDGRLFIV